MTKEQKKAIEIILDKMFNLNYIQECLFELLDVEPLGEEGIDRAFEIGYQVIPLIAGIEQNDWTDELFYEYIDGQISKKYYFKELEKYLKEVK